MATTQQIAAVGVTSGQATASQKGILGKDDFLKMLVTQLRHQDPMNPMDGTEFAAQLAQFSSLEQLSNINTNLEDSIGVNQILTQAISNTMGASLIGKDVRATASSFTYGGEGSVKLGYTLPQNAKSAVVKVFDQNNKLVQTIAGGTSKGDQVVTWTSKDADRGTAVAGTYHFTVEAVDEKGGTLTTTQFVYGTVTSIRFKSSGAVFVIDGLEVPLASILEIMQG
jgi:flagellar basal-body rod modification protein FlgD